MSPCSICRVIVSASVSYSVIMFSPWRRCTSFFYAMPLTLLRQSYLRMKDTFRGEMMLMQRSASSHSWMKRHFLIQPLSQTKRQDDACRCRLRGPVDNEVRYLYFSVIRISLQFASAYTRALGLNQKIKDAVQRTQNTIPIIEDGYVHFRAITAAANQRRRTDGGDICNRCVDAAGYRHCGAVCGGGSAVGSGMAAARRDCDDHLVYRFDTGRLRHLAWSCHI